MSLESLRRGYRGCIGIIDSDHGPGSGVLRGFGGFEGLGV